MDIKKLGEKDKKADMIKKKKKENVFDPPQPAPWYKHEPLEGKTVYVIGEQGYGDTIMFSRFLPWLHAQGCKIYLCVDVLMTGLLWNYRDMVEFLPQGVPIPKVDYSIPMGSMPHFSGCTLDTL